MMKSFVIFVFAILSTFVRSDTLSNFECWKNVLNETTGSKNEKCDEIIQIYKENYEKKFLATAETEAKREFFEKSMHEFKIPEIYSKILAFHSTQGTKENEINEIVDRFSDSVNGVFSILQMSDDEVFSVFNRVYSKFPEKTSLASIDTETACKLNYLIEQSVIKLDDYEFELAPVDQSECSDTYKLFDEKEGEPRQTAAIHIPGTPSEKVNECIKKKNSQGRWMLHDESFELLSKLELSQAQLKKFKSNYSQWFKSKFRGILECLRDLF